jgi:hypothetical protein
MLIIARVRALVHAYFQIGVLDLVGSLDEITANERPAGLCIQNEKMS